jgi:hypothetical protein
LPETLRELGSAGIVAGLLAWLIDESFREQIIEIIKRKREPRAYISEAYGHEIPNHVWEHADNLFRATIVRPSYEATYELKKDIYNDQPAMKINADYTLFVSNSSDRPESFRGRIKLEANALAASATSLRMMEYIHGNTTIGRLQQDEIEKRCAVEKEVGEGGDILYYVWEGPEVTLLPRDNHPMQVRYRLEYYRALDDSDKFLALAATDRLLIIHHPPETKLLVFHISPRTPERVPIGQVGRSLTLRDVTPYQGFVFFWRTER